MYCPQCGVEAQEGDQYCRACGTSLVKEEEEDASAGEREQKTHRKRPFGLSTRDYEHEDDSAALNSLRMFGPVVAVCRVLMRKLNEPMFRAQLLGGAVRVGRHQFEDIYRLVEECAAILNMVTPEVYVVNDPKFNAMTFGTDRPFIILHSSLVDAFSADELTYIIGHELGHIKSEHVLYLNAAWFLAQGAAAYLGRVILIPAQMALDAWMRKAELTADRAGLLCAQDLEDCQISLIKLALGSESLLSRINLDEYLQQAEDLRDGYGPLAELFQTHPFIANRINELREFYGGGYQRILAGRISDRAGGEEMPESERAAQALATALETMVEAERSRVWSARGKWQQTLSDMASVRNGFPDTDAAVQAEFYQAVIRMRLGQGREAVQGFKEFLARYSDHALAPEAQFSLAQCYDHLLKDPAAATRAYADYVRQYPEAAKKES